MQLGGDSQQTGRGKHHSESLTGNQTIDLIHDIVQVDKAKQQQGNQRQPPPGEVEVTVKDDDDQIPVEPGQRQSDGNQLQ